jgi:DNA-binding FadR family transcriptional regulator
MSYETNRRIGPNPGRDGGERVLRQLRHGIESGRLPRQGRLPPERKLAGDLGIGRAALRKALATLEAEGKIWRHVGRGTFVGRAPAEPAAAPPLGARPGSPAEVMELRLMLEPQVAGLAALRASSGEIAFMKRSLAKSEHAADWQTYERWDSTLHQAIAEATRNALIMNVLEGINALRRQDSWRQLRQTSLTPDRQRRYSDQHRAVVEAIERRDSRAAVAAMRAHLETVQRSLFEAADPAEA